MLPDIFSEALATWVATNQPGLKYTTRQEQKRKGEVHTEVWASCLTRCPKRHALERLRKPPVCPEEFTPQDKLRFYYGTQSEKTWAAILGSLYTVQPSYDVRNKGVSGTVDILVTLPGNGINRLAPVEVKWTPNKMQKSHFFQLVAYMYALDVTAGYLMLDHGNGSWDGIGVLKANGSYLAYVPGTNDLYTYYREAFRTTDQEIEGLLAGHDLALGSGGEWGQLATPTTCQCLKQIGAGENSLILPLCPYFCFGTPAKQYGANSDDEVEIDGVLWPLAKGNFG